jgi:hypothetical protein
MAEMKNKTSQSKFIVSDNDFKLVFSKTDESYPVTRDGVTKMVNEWVILSQLSPVSDEVKSIFGDCITADMRIEKSPDTCELIQQLYGPEFIPNTDKTISLSMIQRLQSCLNSEKNIQFVGVILSMLCNIFRYYGIRDEYWTHMYLFAVNIKLIGVYNKFGFKSCDKNNLMMVTTREDLQSLCAAQNPPNFPIENTD